MMTIHSPIGKRRRIPLTPLIDVIFILVMFFLLSSSFGVWRPLEVSLQREGDETAPVQEKAGPSAPSVYIVVKPGPDGSGPVLSVNGVDMALDRLAGELDRLAALGAEGAVLVPGKGTDFQQVVSTLDEARSSDIGRVSLQLK